jgi:metallo-beta-lactamase family protein
MSSRLTFLGATDTVTGSRYLIEADGGRILVDCGLFQGVKTIRDRNRAPLGVAPDSIDAVLLTHAHLDHSGYLLEEEAAHATARGFSVHAHPTPICTAADALACPERFRPVEFDTPVPLVAGLDAVFVPAGHILGASQIRVRQKGAVVHFTGDLGRPDDPLMRPPRDLEAADILVTESTYGDRTHDAEDPEKALGELITRVTRKGGVVLIPAFAVGRTETILPHLSRLRDRGDIPDVPVYPNSPMAINVAEVYERHPDEHRLAGDEVERMYGLARPVRSVDESKLLNLRGGHDVPIRAEVLDLMTMSAHADAGELLSWTKRTPVAPKMTYITHGEPDASDALRARIKRELGRPARVPERGALVDLSDPR